MPKRIETDTMEVKGKEEDHVRGGEMSLKRI
jgi:hypothetical protein